jgi:hypothetical protein
MAYKDVIVEVIGQIGVIKVQLYIPTVFYVVSWPETDRIP